MYCKHCGKEIADDSVFCRYCGGQLLEKAKTREKPLQGFKSLSKKWQIAIMLYVVWFLLSICLWLGNVWDDWFGDRSGWLTEIIVAIAVPMLALFIWYYFARLRKVGEENEANKQIPKENNFGKLVQSVKIVSMPLMDFALQHGKMQVKTVVNTTTDEVFSFCVFTNEQGIETKVQFAKDMGTLRPQEIAELKEQLVVVQKLDGSFELNQR